MSGSLSRQRMLRRWHRRVAAVTSVQLLLWTLSGLYFAFIDIDYVRGHQFKRPAPQSEINLATLFMKRLTLTGSTLRRLNMAERARCFNAIREHIWPKVESGDIRPVVDTTYPLAEVLNAHEHMRLGTHFGKLVLDCRVE